MVGMLLRNETDVVVAGLTYTKGRFAAIDYTVPVFPRWDMKVIRLFVALKMDAFLFFCSKVIIVQFGSFKNFQKPSDLS